MTTLYRIYGKDPAPLYIGITDDYPSRMRHHSEKHWWTDMRRITREEFDTREAAATAERKAIAAEAPRWNKVHSSKRRKAGPVPRAEKHGTPDPWLSQAEAAAHLGVTTRTIRSYIARGLLPARRIEGSRLVRVRLSSVDALLAPISSVGSF